LVFLFNKISHLPAQVCGFEQNTIYMNISAARLIILSWLWASLGAATWAQPSQLPPADYEQRYKKALSLYNSRDYDNANKEWSQLTLQKYNNDLVPFAHYFYGLSLFRVNRFFEAKTILRSLAQRFPDWKKRDEAEYLFTNVCFAEADYGLGIQHAAEVVDPKLRADLESMKVHYFGQITDLEKLKKLYDTYPEERQLALALADLIQRTSTDPRDLILSDKISNRYGVKRKPDNERKDDLSEEIESETVVYQPAVKNKEKASKGYLNIGILFPFGNDGLNPDLRQQANQYALDLYQGMRLAKNKLLTDGTVINLYAFDLNNNIDATLDLINNSHFQQMDLVFGPLYIESNRLMAQFCHDNGIVLVNPLTTNYGLIENQPMAFLNVPSMRTQAVKAAEFALQNFTNKQAAIFYGNGRFDSTFAQLYQYELLARGFEVTTYLPFPSETSIDLSGKKMGHIFLASSDPKIGQNFVSFLERKRSSSPFLAQADALSLEQTSTGFFNTREVYLIDPDFIDKSKPEVDAFQKSYLNKYNTLPSSYAFQGYDMLLFWGKGLQKNGFQKFLQQLQQKKFTENLTLAGYDYRGSNDNQQVTILSCANYRFVPVAGSLPVAPKKGRGNNR
jgi:ABC-type branched-subunit amino acid transport system substrate-binding protein/outer membrane protein assembly factor BamD (BamD/ComL family)